MGADGVKVLRPKIAADLKYLYHFLRQVQLPDGGYDRHFKYLKRIEVLLPPESDQRRIAAVLDKADLLRAQRREALALCDSLTRAVFRTHFSAEIASTIRIPLAEFVREFRYGTSLKSGSQGFPVLRIPNVVGGAIDLAEVKFVDVQTAEFERLRVVDGDVLFVRTNGNHGYVGRCAVFRAEQVACTGYDSGAFIYASYLIRARLNQEQLLPEVLQACLTSGEGRRELMAQSKTSAGQFNINTEGLGSVQVPRFPRAKQVAFVEKANRIQQVRRELERQLREFEALFASLQHRAFRGEL